MVFSLQAGKTSVSDSAVFLSQVIFIVVDQRVEIRLTVFPLPERRFENLAVLAAQLIELKGNSLFLARAVVVQPFFFLSYHFPDLTACHGRRIRRRKSRSGVIFQQNVVIGFPGPDVIERIAPVVVNRNHKRLLQIQVHDAFQLFVLAEIGVAGNNDPPVGVGIPVDDNQIFDQIFLNIARNDNFPLDGIGDVVRFKNNRSV